MNRLQKKCLIASTGFHLLLGVILLIGPAFLSSNTKPEDVSVIEFLPMITSDSAAAGGGDPKGGTPPPTVVPVPPTPATPVVTPPAPAPVVEKTPPNEPVKKPRIREVTPPNEPKESPEAVKPSAHKIEVSTTPVIRKYDPQAAAKAKAAAEAKATAAENKRIASAINRAASNFSDNFSGETSIVLKGSGGGGVPYGNWLSAIKKIYTDAWVVPDGVTDDSATVTASITIARNGDVLSRSIVRPSGNPLVDHSVKATLDRVTRAAPLPEGAKEDQRTVTINFNVKAKQGLG